MSRRDDRHRPADSARIPPRPTVCQFNLRAHFDRAGYDEACTWSEQCLGTAGDSMLQETADAWHGLASIDLNWGDYEAARKRFQRALEVRCRYTRPSPPWTAH